jgi:hypothetical protein
MKKSYLSLLLLLTIFGCHASINPVKTDLLYSGHVFSVPQNAFVIAAIGGDDNILILRYGPERGKKYLAFSDITGDNSVEFQCEPSAFFEALFTASTGEGCNQDELNAFKRVFIKNHDIGQWVGDKLTVYFSISQQQSFLFVFDDAGKAIKIDTDYLSKTDLKEVVDGAL